MKPTKVEPGQRWIVCANGCEGVIGPFVPGRQHERDGGLYKLSPDVNCGQSTAGHWAMWDRNPYSKLVTSSPDGNRVGSDLPSSSVRPKPAKGQRWQWWGGSGSIVTLYDHVETSPDSSGKNGMRWTTSAYGGCGIVDEHFERGDLDYIDGPAEAPTHVEEQSKPIRGEPVRDVKNPAVPWPEPAVGSEWDIYVDGHLGGSGQFDVHSCHLPPQTNTFLGYFRRGGARNSVGQRLEYIPHGWDYVTKQPKAQATRQCGGICVSRFGAQIGTCLLMLGHGLASNGCTRTVPHAEAKSEPKQPTPAEDVKKSPIRIVGVYGWGYPECDATTAQLMRTNGHTTDPPPIIENDSRRYPPSRDLDQDIPNSWEW